MTTQLQTRPAETLEIWEKANVPPEIWAAMKSSLYPGAKEESILMVWDYCKAKKLDPLQKPVHIVPMWIIDKKTDKGEMRDVIMPGIITNRIQASRSGMHAGTSEPEFGPDITKKLGGIEFTYPEWCRVIVKKFLNGQIIDYPAKEYWIENYATAGKDKLEPNAMWKKRPYAQLAKCTEAQALRKAFPDHVDQNYTAEEMEGKTIEGDLRDVTSRNGGGSDKVYASTTERLIANLGGATVANTATVNDDAHTPEIMVEPEVQISCAEQLTILIGEKAVPIEVMQKWLTKAGVNKLSDMSEAELMKCIAYVHEKY
jgi:phage recombination protein Bet